MVLFQLVHHYHQSKNRQRNQPSEKALESFTLSGENHFDSEFAPVFIRLKLDIVSFRVYISDFLVPLHEVVVFVQEKKTNVGEEKQGILVGENVGIGP